MAEEFQEADVIFSDDNDFDHHDGNDYTSFGYQEVQDMLMSRQNDSRSGGGSRHHKKNKKKKTTTSSSSVSNSLPVNINIPDNLFQYVDAGELEEEYGDGEMVPPHVIVARRIAGRMAPFSVCTGNGRTLKGRDLSRVRNSILRMTGFLET